MKGMFRQEISGGESSQWIRANLNFSACYKIDSKEPWRWEKKNYIQHFRWCEGCHLVFDIFPCPPKYEGIEKKEKHSYYIHHLYKILVLLTNKAELIKNVLFLKYISWLLHVSLSISFTQSMCHIYGHQLIRYLLLVISPVRDVSLLLNLHNY